MHYKKLKTLIMCSFLGFSAAPAAVLAEDPARISVSCPKGFSMAEPLCQAFLEGLSRHYPTAAFCHAATPHGVIRLHAAQRGTTRLDAQVFWTDAAGDTNGPVLGLDVADSDLSGAMMPDFVQHVIERSNLPPLEGLTRNGAPFDPSTQETSKCDT